MAAAGSAFFGNGARNILVTIVLAASLVSGDTVVNLLLGNSPIGESDIRFRGKVVGSIIGADSTATTYDVACDTTGSIAFPFTTPACVGGDHVTITQGSSTMFLTGTYVTATSSMNYREGCTFSNTQTVTCSLTNTISEVVVYDKGKTGTNQFIQTSSGVNAPPSNPPLYIPVTITAGLEKLNGSQVTGASTPAITGASSSPTAPSAAGSAVTSKPTSGAGQAIMKGSWAPLLVMLMFGHQ